MSDQSIYNKTYAAFLFDMDGTLLNSIAAAERVWGAWAIKHGLDPVTFLPTMHGARGIDTITRLGLPGVDPAHEADLILQGEIEDVEGVVAIAGAISFLNALPSDKWAIVTSSPLNLAKRRLQAAGIAMPQIIVTGEDVKTGKPNPDCFLLGASRLGVKADDCLVFEDATAGILAAEGAGADVMVITTTHAHHVETAHETIVDFTKISASFENNRMRLARA